MQHHNIFLLKLLIISILFTSCINSSRKEDNLYGQENQLPEVAILGTLHFVSKNNTVTQKFTEVNSDKRQNEIKALVRSLKKFQPTKIAVERPYYNEGELNKRYHGYLNGNYPLSEEETDQIAFRLAKALGHKRLYLAYSPVEFAFDSTMAFAKANGQSKIIDSIINNARELANEYDRIAEKKTINEAIHYLNTERAMDKNHYGYLLLCQIGDKENYVGADAVGDWYKSNIKIFETVRKMADSKSDRILVIYGHGHCKILNQLIDDSPELQLVKINDYLK